MTSHTVLGMEGMMLRVWYERNVKLIMDWYAVQKPFIPYGRFLRNKKPLCMENISVRPSFIHYQPSKHVGFS